MNITKILRAIRDHGAKLALRAIYACIKPWTRVHPEKVLFLSRHSNTETLDFRRLREELTRQFPGIKITSISRRFEGKVKDIPPFAWAVVRSLFHLASAKTCVLDSYWPGVSIIKHHPELKVYQMWHSLGKVKRTGRQAVGKAQGRAAGLAGILRMHDGYDFVVAGGTYWNRDYCETFGVSKEQVLHFGLPRADELVHGRDRIASRIYGEYPALKLKPVILYVPTFRRSKHSLEGIGELIRCIDHTDFSLVIKPHQEDRMNLRIEKDVFECPEFSGFELLTIADYVVTDYSSIALEAALIDVPTYYYVYDYEEYSSENGLNIDLSLEMPGCVFFNAQDLGHALKKTYPFETLKKYQKKYLFDNPGSSTKHLAEHILEKGGVC